MLYILIGFLPALCSAQINWLEKAQSSYIVDSSLKYANLHYNEVKSEQGSMESVITACYLGKQLVIKSRYTRAEKLLQETWNLPFTKKSPEARARINLELANLHKYREEYATALELYLSALKLTKKTNNRSLEVTIMVDVAEYYRRVTKFGLARKRILEAQAAYEAYALKDSAILIRIYHRAAAISNERNDIRGSILLSHKALKLARDANYPYSQGISLNELGYSYKNLHRYDTAVTLYRQAEEIWFKLGAYREAVNAMNNRAMLYAHADYPRAQIFQLYRAVIDTVQNNQVDFSLSSVYQYLHLQHAGMGDSATAYRYLVLYHHEEMRQEQLRNDIAVTNITEQYEAEKVRSEMLEVSDQLERKKEETTRIYFFLITLGVLFIVIGFLAYKLNRSNNKLVDRNKEKDTLLQEIHHRVKNNLQIISSLLELQTRKTTDPSTISIMQEGQNRVKAMSLIHKKLYQNEDLARVEFQAYVDDLTATLYQVFNSGNQAIDHQIEAENIYFDIDTAIPLGLIINELVTNAYKYAFDEVANPQLRIQIDSLQNGEYQLRVSDNGPGLAPDFNIKEVKSLGLRLVSRLTKQLLGTMEYERDGNINTFAITFKDTLTRKAIE